MSYYLDSSVILRALLGQPDSWVEWGRSEGWFSSRLARSETRRALDRLRLTAVLDDEGTSAVLTEFLKVEDAMHWLEVTSDIIEAVALPFPTVVGTLDAIHIVSADLLRRQREPQLTFVTHDRRQALAARAMGLATTG